MEAAWTRTPDDVLAHFHVDQAVGLNAVQVAQNQKLYGKNGARPDISSGRFKR